MKNKFLGIFLLALTYGCVSREEVVATVWLNNFSPDDLCLTNPELWNYGFYRKLNNGKIEFLSICKQEARKMFAIPEDDFNRILDRALPKKEESP